MVIAVWAVLWAMPCYSDHPFSGGETTYVIPRAQASDRGAFSRPATNLSIVRRGDFFAGNSFFQNAWVSAPASTKARDGLGPLFNTMSCQSCHIKDGRGRPPRGNEEMLSMLIRISHQPLEGQTVSKQIGVIPDKLYGTQIQSRGIQGVAGEMKPVIKWEEISGAFADGQKYTLRKPVYELTDPKYGPVHSNLQISGRVAPVLVGVGLLDTLDEATILKMQDPEDANGDGISGRANLVWDVVQQKQVLGRFGWKAEQPNIRQQVAAAFSEDIGITSSLFPQDSMSKLQANVIQAENGGPPEVSDEILSLVTFYCKHLAVPARRSHESNLIQQGEQLFGEIGCASCHVDTLVTGEDPGFPELSGQEIHAYTDLLLHDMGEGLADGRPVFEATGREWRTPPLWGMGVIFRVNRHTDLLHDGRARNATEAILWHGGEAKKSREAFVQMPLNERRALLSFLKSL